MLLLILSIAFAQDNEEPKVVYKEKTEIDFEGLEIEGHMLKPHGSIIRERKQANLVRFYI